MFPSSKNFIILEKVDSTNNYAMAKVQKGELCSDDAIFAIEQTAGKGRRGKNWKSKPAENIILTIVKQMQWLPISNQFDLSLAVSLGCFDFVLKYIKENIKIKWPNDIYINDRKAGGILIENVIKGNLWQWAIVGIGLNINQENFDPETGNPVSFKSISGKNYDVIELAKELQHSILKRIYLLQDEPTNNFLAEFNEKLFCRNEKVKLKRGNAVFETRIICVSAKGELITEDTLERRFKFDEVDWQVK